MFLGLKAGGHDTAAAVVRNDGAIVAAIAQERLDRVKHSDAFPMAAILACAAEAGIELAELRGAYIPYRYPHAILSAGVRPVLRFRGATLRDAALLARRVRVRHLAAQRALRGVGSIAPVVMLDHHDCHAASAYLTSPFDRAAIVTVDGRGERATVRIYKGGNGRLRRLNTVGAYPHSIGLLYSAVTHHLGFRPDADEGTVMALASYGDPARFAQVFGRLLTYSRGRLSVDLRLFAPYRQPRWLLSETFVRATTARREAGDPVLQIHADLAASLQHQVEHVVEQIVRDALIRAGSRNLCLAGGVALNSVINGRLMTRRVVERLHVQSAPADDGAVLGAALLGFSGSSPRRREPFPADRLPLSPFLGPTATARSSRDCLDRFLARTPGAYRLYRGPDQLVRTAEQLAAGAVVGLFEGRAEFGPRALGHRSILADPSRLGMADRLNRTVKFRERFRPYAVAILAEQATELVDRAAPSPHMSMVFHARPAARERLAGVVHVDSSVRVQTVARDGPTRLRRLLELFFELTGTPALVNTSLNVKGQPMVETQEDALECLHGTGMDALLVDGCLVSKEPPLPKRECAPRPSGTEVLAAARMLSSR